MPQNAATKRESHLVSYQIIENGEGRFSFAEGDPSIFDIVITDNAAIYGSVPLIPGKESLGTKELKVEIMALDSSRDYNFNHYRIKIVVTAVIEPEVEAKCHELGTEEFRKPVAMKDLRRTAKEAWEEKRRHDQHIDQCKKIFISSTMHDLEAERWVVKQAVEDLGHKYVVWLAEAVPPGSQPPRKICQQAVRECDIFVLLIGERYGAIRVKGDISATEDEYNTACESGKPILVFVKDVPDREPRARAFLTRVGSFIDGRWIKLFTDPEHLRFEVQKAIQEQAMNMRGGESAPMWRRSE